MKRYAICVGKRWESNSNIGLYEVLEVSEDNFTKHRKHSKSEWVVHTMRENYNEWGGVFIEI